jgi:CubicO group peptidase (beta-lactamase class C family)
MSQLVAPGFEQVGELFTRHLDALGVGGGAFCAYVDGAPVVDVWGGNAGPDRRWVEDTLTVIMSSTKGLSTMCVQLLVDRGLIDVDEPVATYWPEFAQAGKAGVLVRHVLTHTAGVLSWPGANAQLQWDGTGWDDHAAIASGLAAVAPAWEPGTRQGYHALSYGWLTGELVRRVSGVSIGTFWRREIAEPMGIDAWIGTPPEQQSRVADLTDGLLDDLPRALRPMLGVAQRRLRDPRTLNGQAYLGDGTTSVMDHADSLFTSPKFLAHELPGGNGTATARALARAYGILAMGGELDGRRVWSPEVVERFARVAVSMPDQMMVEVALPGLRRLLSAPVDRSLGYLVNPKTPGQGRRFGPSRTAFGHDGAGGQIAFADRSARISVGFVRNQLSSSPKASNRLIEALYRCAGR